MNIWQREVRLITVLSSSLRPFNFFSGRDLMRTVSSGTSGCPHGPCAQEEGTHVGCKAFLQFWVCFSLFLYNFLLRKVPLSAPTATASAQGCHHPTCSTGAHAAAVQGGANGMQSLRKPRANLTAGKKEKGKRSRRLLWAVMGAAALCSPRSQGLGLPRWLSASFHST